ncbi:AAA domain-containing protein [Breznakiellaceae bacterium SP9]
MMLFDKYQYDEADIKKRGYSQHCPAFSEDGTKFWVKWIIGIEKSSAKIKMLTDQLRHLQKATHECLPDIIEYKFDEEQKAYAIVYKYLEKVESLENKAKFLDIQDIMSGLIDLAECLNTLQSKHTISHGDIHPANILIDENSQFFIIDFQLAEITRTLSQEKALEIFAKQFAAPEKLGRLSHDGFLYQADIYSFGKIIDWIFHERQEEIPEEQNRQLQRLLAEKPVDRLKWQEVVDMLKKYPTFSETKNIQIAFSRDVGFSIIPQLNAANPVFDMSPTKPDNPRYSYFLSIVIGNTILGCLWTASEQKLFVNRLDPDSKYIEQKIRDGKKLPFKVRFDKDVHTDSDLTPYFQKWFSQKQKQYSLKEQGKAIRDELQFYRELLEKEMEVINKNSLRLQYSGFEIKDNAVIFQIKENEKYSTRDFILNHIDNGNAINSDGIEYIVSANADRKQNKESVTFTGTPYEYEKYENKEGDSLYQFKIKDYEHLEKNSIPKTGYIFENTMQKEEEKKRQLDAITKAERNEVQNPGLTYSLFAPSELPAVLSNYDPLECVYQKNKEGNSFYYSDNQNKAIRNALDKSPLSIIQGPPGTGKTTVITEIVFQILAEKPESKILITSQTNNAVDQVLENLLKNDIPILRLSGITAPKIKEIQAHTLNKKLDNWKVQVKENTEKNFEKLKNEHVSKMKPFTKYLVEQSIKEVDWIKRKALIEEIAGKNSDMEKFRNLPDEKSEALVLLDEVLKIDYSRLHDLSELHQDWLATISSLNEESEINKKLIDSIRVIGATCNHIAAKKYSKWDFEFDYVIMDEAGKATIAESLVPIITGNNLILVGDHRQLRPKLTNTWEVEKWLRNKFRKESEELEDWDDYFNRPSLFEQVITQIDPDYKAQLTKCRRLPAEQVVLTSKCFYESEGDEPIEPVKREVSAEHNLPLMIDSSLFFIDTGSGYKNKKDKDRSSYNEVSRKIVIDVLTQINSYEKVKDYSFGVIVCYKAQFYDLKKMIDKLKGQRQLDFISKWQREEEKLTVSVVDRFQGLERDIIILDLVKSGVGLDLGFMEVPNRINVALSRNKRLLIIVGDYHGIVNAKTRKRNGEKAALQHYLEKIKPEWIIPAEKIKGLFK